MLRKLGCFKKTKKLNTSDKMLQCYLVQLNYNCSSDHYPESIFAVRKLQQLARLSLDLFAETGHFYKKSL